VLSFRSYIYRYLNMQNLRRASSNYITVHLVKLFVKQDKNIRYE